METEQVYVVNITPEAEEYYKKLLAYLYTTHSEGSASDKSEEILLMAMSLNKMPYRGRDEQLLAYLGKGHKYLVYPITSRNTVKIIYFIDESSRNVYVTDFFPTMKDAEEIVGRNQ